MDGEGPRCPFGPCPEALGDAAIWNAPPPFTFDDADPQHVDDEVISFNGPMVTSAIRRWANKNGIVGARLRYENFMSAFAEEAYSRWNEDRVCELFALHEENGICNPNWVPEDPFGDPPPLP